MGCDGSVFACVGVLVGTDGDGWGVEVCTVRCCAVRTGAVGRERVLEPVPGTDGWTGDDGGGIDGWIGWMDSPIWFEVEGVR